MVEHSQSMSSLRQQSNSSKNTPFPQTQNHLVALSRRSDQSLNEAVMNQMANDGGVGGTGATRELESKTSIHAVQEQSAKHGMGTGFQTSTTSEQRQSKKVRVNNAANKVTNRRVPHIMVSSPPPKKALSRRKSMDNSNAGVMNTESDYAA